MAQQGQIKISYLMSDLGGGTGNHLLQMLRHAGKDLDIDLISGAKLTARIEPSVNVHYLKALPWCDRYPLSQMHRFQQIMRLCAARQPDILHAYFFWPIIYGRLLKMCGRVKILVENREDQGFNWGRHEYAWLRLTRTVPDRVICVSEAVRQTVLKNEGTAPAKTLVIHNGIEPTAADQSLRQQVRTELGLKREHQVIGMVANFNRAVKGVEYFIEAAPLILTQCPHARFLLFGRGKFEPQLRERAQELGVGEQVGFAGFRRDIDRFYQAMDISVLTSLSEGLSITLLESMNRGLPTIATSVGGNPEVIVDGETGFLVPPKNVLVFAEKAVTLLNDNDLAKRMGEAGRKRAAEHFSLENTAAKYFALYSSLPGKAPAVPS